MGGGGGGGSQRLLCLNPTTVMVVFLFGLWLLLGCDKKPQKADAPTISKSDEQSTSDCL